LPDEFRRPVAQVRIATVAAGVGVEDEPGFQGQSYRSLPRPARNARIFLVTIPIRSAGFTTEGLQPTDGLTTDYPDFTDTRTN
jgi:hypothetical protein